jgi:hypothetical protein
MRPDSLRVLSLAFVALFLAACKTVTVEQPTADSVHITAPDIVLSFPSGRPDPLEVTLNGADISAQFSVSETGATATGANIRSFLVDGKNALKVVKPNTPTRFFVFDQSGPMVHITNVNEGGSIGISGYVEDPSGIASVRVNGADVSLDAGNAFSVSVANSNFVEFVSTDTNGFERRQKFARPSVAIGNAMALRVARSGLDFAVAEIEDLLVSDSLSDLISAVNPILEQSFLGNSITADVNSASLDTANVDFNITGTGGQFSLSGDVTGLVADFSAEIDPLIGWNWTINGKFFLDRATFSADASVSVSGGNVAVDVSVNTLDLDRIRSDINNFPDWLLTPIYEVFEWLFEIIIKGQVEGLAEEKLTEFLDAFPDSIVIDIDGSQVKPLVTPEAVTSPSNGLNLRLGAHIYALTANGPNQLGSAYDSAGAIPTPTTTAPGDTARDVGVVIGENTINQALAAVVESGILNVALTVADLPGIGDVDPSANNVRVRVAPTTAPVIDLISGQENGLGRLTLNDFYIAFDVMPSGSSEFQTFLGATLDISAAADLGVTADNAIAIDLVGTPLFVIRDLDDAASIKFDEGLAQALFDEFLPVVLPPIMNAIGAIPLPTFEGYGVNVGALWVVDAAGDYVGLTADLVKVATTASAPAPMTFASIGGTAQAASLSLSGGTTVKDDTVVISVGGMNPSAGDLQYRYSLDGAPYGLWKSGDEITLYGVRTGDHTVTVCARTALLVEDPDCVALEFTVE